MATEFGHNIQLVIDRIRGKVRHFDPADSFSMGPREARSLAQLSCELESIFYDHEGLIAQKWHNYLAVYDQHFQALRERTNGTPRILELGISRGGSLQLWRKYFGEGAAIVGIDIDPDCAARVDAGSHAIIGNQSDATVLASALERLGGGVDLVIDDGSHLGRHQIATFEYLYPRLSDRGLYVCEDLHCAYWPDYEGGFRRDGTFIEYSKTLIDQLHAWCLEDPLQSEFMGFARTTFGIFVYLGAIVIEKRPVERPYHVQIGNPGRTL